MPIARLFVRIVVLALAVFIVPLVFAGDSIVGTWNLVSISTEDTDTGEVTHPYGDHPHGRLTYTLGGHMMAILTVDGRKRLGTNRFSGSVDDQAEAYRTMNAYAGTYTLTDTGVVHHVEVASIESWVGTDQVRFTKLEGDTLTIKAHRSARPQTANYVLAPWCGRGATRSRVMSRRATEYVAALRCCEGADAAASVAALPADAG